MIDLLADEPNMVKGVTVVVAAFVLFIGSVYLLLSAVFGPAWGISSWPCPSSAG
jgi:hypothetical protein